MHRWRISIHMRLRSDIWFCVYGSPIMESAFFRLEAGLFFSLRVKDFLVEMVSLFLRTYPLFKNGIQTGIHFSTSFPDNTVVS
jgi:hypothetical protein